MQKKVKENEKSIWKADNVKVVFSGPCIQPWESVVFVRNTNEILYYYYTMTVYRKVKKEWKKEFSADTYDFPSILALKDAIKTLLNADITDGTWQIDKSEDYYGKSDAVWYKKSYDTAQFINEDYYSLERVVRIWEGEEYETFSLTVGSGSDDGMNEQSDSIKTITINFLNREQIQMLADTVDDFIQKEMDRYNEAQQKRLEQEKTRREIKNGKVYEYLCEDEDKKHSLKEVYVPGDIVNITILDRKDGQETFTAFCECRLENVEKSNIGFNGYVVVSGGYKQIRHTTEPIKEKKIKIPVELITYMFSDVEKEKLPYNKKQCKEDFMSILTPEEKREFAEEPVDWLYEKWQSAIIGRTWMCRDEHGFENPKKKVKWIIKKIKKECQKVLKDGDVDEK